MSVKRALLPYMPDSAMAQYRLRRELFRARFGLRQASAPTEVNVEVLADRHHARRWLLATGDTCRTVNPSALGLPAREFVAIPTDTDALAIRESGEPLRVLAARYGCAESTISRIRNGITYRHLR